MRALLVPKMLAPLAVLPLLLPGAALAAAATAAQNVNVRSGPSTDYSIVTQLHQGDPVDVRQCEGLFCQVTFDGKSGWVSASFLTRDYVPRAPAAQTQTATSSSMSDPAPARVAAVPSQPADGSFPAAYDGAAADNLPPADVTGADAGSTDGGYPDQPALSSSVTLPPDSGDTIVSVDAPRPKADVPGGALAGPDDAAMAPDSPDTLDPPYGNTDSAPGWGSRFGWRAGIAAAEDPTLARRACLLPEAGGRSVCVGTGQTARGLAGAGYDMAFLRNPGHLAVTVCTTVGDCRSYHGSAALELTPGEAVSSISADAPAY
ncbi:MAG: SH3 domain-containing protein [Devosia sp.]|nr:SH3 domain-containing protein [Devosia sp.]